MPKAHCASYNLAFKSKIVAEVEATINNSEIAVYEGINPIVCHAVLHVCLATRRIKCLSLVFFCK